MHGIILAAAITLHPVLGGGDCTDPQSNLQMTLCAEQGYQDADKELNDVWQKVMAYIDGIGADVMPAKEKDTWRKGMIDAEKAWSTFKDSDCEVGVAHEWWGGSGARLAIAACLRDHTLQRTKELRERYLNN